MSPLRTLKPRTSSPSPPQSPSRRLRPWRPSRRSSGAPLAPQASHPPRRSRKQNEHVTTAGARNNETIKPETKPIHNGCITRRRSTGTTLASRDESWSRARLRPTLLGNVYQKYAVLIMRGIANGRNQKLAWQSTLSSSRGAGSQRIMMRESLPTMEGSVQPPTVTDEEGTHVGAWRQKVLADTHLIITILIISHHNNISWRLCFVVP